MKPIPGYEGLYSVDMFGNIWSFRTKKNLKWLVQRGYANVGLRKNGNLKRFSVHRLVYGTFVGTIPTHLQINHKDGHKLNNHLFNLEAVTALENTTHAWKIGLSKRVVGSRNSLAKLTEQDIIIIRSLSRKGVAQRHIASKFRVDQSNISKILKGVTWTHV